MKKETELGSVRCSFTASTISLVALIGGGSGSEQEKRRPVIFKAGPSHKNGRTAIGELRNDIWGGARTFNHAMGPVQSTL